MPTTCGSWSSSNEGAAELAPRVGRDRCALDELRRRLTMAGLEVEEVHRVGQDWRDVRVGRIVDLQAHPRREALQVAEVDLGDGRITVVTGATNLKQGDIVPHVAAGGRLPGGEVGRRDFAGIASEGMVCS